MTHRRSGLGLTHILVLAGLLGLVLWRGHTLIEQGSKTPEPTPPPPPRAVTFLVSVEGLEDGDIPLLIEPLAQKGFVVRTGKIAIRHPVKLLQDTASSADPSPLCVLVKGPAGPRQSPRRGVLLAHVDGPVAVMKVRTLLDERTSVRDKVVWLHLRDLGLPPPRPRAARRALRRAGIPPSAWSTTGDSKRRPTLDSANAPRAIRLLHERGLDSLRRAVIALSTGGRLWVANTIVMIGAPTVHGESQDVQPLLAATVSPGPDPLRCPSLGDLVDLLDGSQKIWPMPR